MSCCGQEMGGLRLSTMGLRIRHPSSNRPLAGDRRYLSPGSPLLPVYGQRTRVEEDGEVSGCPEVVGVDDGWHGGPE